MYILFLKFYKGECPKCGAIRIQRKGPHGLFFGCSRFPHCNGKLDYADRIPNATSTPAR